MKEGVIKMKKEEIALQSYDENFNEYIKRLQSQRDKIVFENGKTSELDDQKKYCEMISKIKDYIIDEIYNLVYFKIKLPFYKIIITNSNLDYKKTFVIDERETRICFEKLANLLEKTTGLNVTLKNFKEINVKMIEITWSGDSTE